MSKRYKYVVVGKGLFGTAAAKYLSKYSDSVALIGPDEPKDFKTHTGVFASHYDEGRITRIIDSDPIWSILAERSIHSYAEIEQRAGSAFYNSVGCLKVAFLGNQNSPFPSIEKSAKQSNLTVERYASSSLSNKFSPYRFSNGEEALFEKAPAGYISPRTLVSCQLSIAQSQGVDVFTEVVDSVQSSESVVYITTTCGREVRSEKVLLANGAFANMLLKKPIALINKARTIALVEVEPAEADIPCLVYYFSKQTSLTHVYVLPPIKYPNGKFYWKIGGDNMPDVKLQSVTELCKWFQSDGEPVHAEQLKQALFQLVPTLKKSALSQHSAPCVLCYTKTGYPYIDCIENNRLYVVVGGCGTAAKSSDEIGKIAAKLCINNKWSYDLDPKLFKIL